MKLQLNESMRLTKEEKKGGIIIPFIAALIAIMLGDIVLMPFGSAEMANNPTMLYNLMGLFVDIVPIVLVLLFCIVFEKRKLPSLGINNKNILKRYSTGAFIGFVMMCATFLINLLFKSITVSTNPEGISWIFVIISLFGYMVQGFNEEFICRGFLMNSIAARKGPLAGIILNTLFFGALHLLNPGVTALSFINIVLFGFVASFLFYKTNSIWFVGAIHAIWNYFQGIIFGTQVSGLSIFSSVFKSMPVAGKEFINGGIFGFEGGLAVTIVFGITLIVSLVLIKKETQN